jgi:hypothetical protein
MRPIADDLPESVVRWFSTPESNVTLEGEKVTADSVVQCLQLPTVRRLYFYDTPNINDVALKPLADVQSLEALGFRNAQVSGEGFPSLEQLPKFNRVFLKKCPLTEAGLEHLLKCARIEIAGDIHLESIKLGSVEVTNRNGSKTIKEGELITVRGSFISHRFVPFSVYMMGGWWFDGGALSCRVIREPISSLERIRRRDLRTRPDGAKLKLESGWIDDPMLAWLSVRWK